MCCRSPPLELGLIKLSSYGFRESRLPSAGDAGDMGNLKSGTGCDPSLGEFLFEPSLELLGPEVLLLYNACRSGGYEAVRRGDGCELKGRCG